MEIETLRAPITYQKHAWPANREIHDTHISWSVQSELQEIASTLAVALIGLHQPHPGIYGTISSPNTKMVWDEEIGTITGVWQTKLC